LGSILTQNNCISQLCWMRHCWWNNHFFQDYYACQLPCNYEASYGLEFMHENLDHLVQQPTSFPLIILMAKTNWIVYGHGYGQHRGWEMFFKYGVYEE
jgi:hypothetical protein